MSTSTSQETSGAVLGFWQRADGFMAAVSYVLASLVMTTMTKYAASAWRFPGSSFLLLIECCATVLALQMQAPSERPYQPFSRKVLRYLPLVTLAKAMNMYLSFVAMKRTSLPVYNVLKRLQPVYALVQDWLIRGTLATGKEQLGVAMICLGTAITGSGDLEFDPVGYGVALVAAGCQSLYLVLARHAQDHIPGLTNVDLLFYTAFFNSAVFAPLSIAEAGDILQFLAVPGECGRLACFLLPYVVLGVVLNYTTFWCTAANSPLATAVAGSAKGILSTLVGVLAFTAQLTLVGWLGLVGSTLGGLVYSLAQAMKPKSSSKKQASEKRD